MYRSLLCGGRRGILAFLSRGASFFLGGRAFAAPAAPFVPAGFRALSLSFLTDSHARVCPYATSWSCLAAKLTRPAAQDAAERDDDGLWGAQE